MNVLPRTQFGNPILRNVAQPLEVEGIVSADAQSLIADMRHTLVEKKLGIGLAAPQVDKNLAIAVIMIQKTVTRPNAEPFELTIINPAITEYIGRRTQLWEGCISAGSHGKADLFAKVPRYKKIRIEYYDQHGKKHDCYYTGLQAHVLQHEVDHLNGILFVDRVKDSTTYMTYAEYKKSIKSVKT
jgi:peptide deformylase